MYLIRFKLIVCLIKLRWVAIADKHVKYEGCWKTVDEFLNVQILCIFRFC